MRRVLVVVVGLVVASSLGACGTGGGPAGTVTVAPSSLPSAASATALAAPDGWVHRPAPGAPSAAQVAEAFDVVRTYAGAAAADATPYRLWAGRLDRMYGWRTAIVALRVPGGSYVVLARSWRDGSEGVVVDDVVARRPPGPVEDLLFAFWPDHKDSIAPPYPAVVLAPSRAVVALVGGAGGRPVGMTDGAAVLSFGDGELGLELRDAAGAVVAEIPVQEMAWSDRLGG